MNFEILIEELLNELSGAEIYQKYYNKIPYDIFLNIVKSDPKSVIDEQGNPTTLGKYVKLLISLYQKGGLQIEDLDKASEYLGYVYQHRIAIDLGKIKELGDLYNLVKDYIAKDSQSLDDVLKVLSKDEYKVLHNGEEWYIFQPLTEKASCYLGVNTEWCTTWGPYTLNKKHKDRTNMYQQYSKNGPLYIMIRKNNPSEKYQFHFESKQFMDKDDHRINIKEFFNGKNELINYYFPSLTRKVSDEQLKLELKRIDILPDEVGMGLIQKAIGQVNNDLVNALLNQDDEKLSELIVSDNIDGGFEVYEGKLTFDVNTIDSNSQQVYDNIRYHEYETNEGWNFVYEDMRDRGIDEYERENLVSFIEKYYEENPSEFSSSFGIKNKENFVETFIDNYVENSDIQEAYWSNTADLSHQSYENENQAAADAIKSDIYIDDNNRGYRYEIGVVKFVQFLIKKDITKIDDETKNSLENVMDEFIDYLGHGGEWERIYDFDLQFPKYGDGGDLTKETNKYFEDMLNDVEQNKECFSLRTKLNDILKQYFKNSTTFENDHIKVRLKNNQIDCSTGMVKIEYTNKDTGETYGGWRDPKDGVKVDNLVSLLTNYKLFESYSKFRKLIK